MTENLSVTITGWIPVTVYVSIDTRKQLEGLKPFFKEQKAWAREQPMASIVGLSRREADARRGLWAEKKAKLRREGQLIDSLNALVTGGLCQEIDKREWNRVWDPYPHQARAQGRSPGSPSGVWEAPIPVRLPADLVNTVYAACWHTSKEPSTLLEKWQQRHPKAHPNRTMQPGCDAAALAEYRQICAKITHRGDVWRAAVINGINNARTRQNPAAGMR